MYETNQPLSPVAMRYGLLTGLVLIIFSFIIMLTGMLGNTGVSWISYLILIGGIIMALKHYKNSNQGFMSYGQGVGIGTILSLVAGVLAGIFTYIYMKFIDSTVVSNMMEAQRAEMEEKLDAQGMSDEQIEQAFAMSEKFTTPEMMLVFGILGYLMIGFILSLIIAAIMKNARPEFE